MQVSDFDLSLLCRVLTIGSFLNELSIAYIKASCVILGSLKVCQRLQVRFLQQLPNVLITIK